MIRGAYKAINSISGRWEAVTNLRDEIAFYTTVAFVFVLGLFASIKETTTRIDFSFPFAASWGI